MRTTSRAAALLICLAAVGAVGAAGAAEGKDVLELRALTWQKGGDVRITVPADEGGAAVTENEKQIPEPRCEPTDRVIPAGPGLAMSGKVGDDHRVIPRQRLDHGPPVLEAATQAVDQEQDRAGAGLGVADRAAVQRLCLELHALHATDAPGESPTFEG